MTYSKTIDVGLNFTDYLPLFQDFEDPHFTLTIRRIAMGNDVGTGRINHFSVLDYQKGIEYNCSNASDVLLNRGEMKLMTDDSSVIAGIPSLQMNHGGLDCELNGMSVGTSVGKIRIHKTPDGYRKVLK